MSSRQDDSRPLRRLSPYLTDAVLLAVLLLVLVLSWHGLPARAPSDLGAAAREAISRQLGGASARRGGEIPPAPRLAHGSP